MKTVLFSLLLLLFSTAYAEKRLTVVGLFPNMVVVNIDGQRTVLRTGQSTSNGVKLISATSEQAIFEINGKQQIHILGHSPSYKITPPVFDSVHIRPDINGLYRVDGMIADQQVVFIVDTGASHVAMNTTKADELNIDYSQATKTDVETASGVVSAYAVYLPVITVGNIKVRDVQTLILDSPLPRDILLGMTFLSNLEIQHKGRIMMLKKRY